MEKEMLSILEAAAQLGVSKGTVHKLIKVGELKAHRKTLAPYSAYQVDAASVTAYDKRRRTPALNARRRPCQVTVSHFRLSEPARPRQAPLQPNESPRGLEPRNSDISSEPPPTERATRSRPKKHASLFLSSRS